MSSELFFMWEAVITLLNLYSSAEAIAYWENELCFIFLFVLFNGIAPRIDY